MLEPNYSSCVAGLGLAAAAWALYAAYGLLLNPPAHRRLSSHVPSATKTLWAEVQYTWTLARKRPEELLPFFMESIKKYGPVVHFNFYGKSVVLLNDPDDIKTLLSSKSNITKGPAYDMLKPWLNDGLLLSTGSKWQSRRKLLTNTFHLKTLDLYNESINKNSRILTKKLLEASNSDKEISVKQYVTLCSLDIISETIMGTELRTQEGESVEYVNCTQNVRRTLIERVYKFWLRNNLIFSLSKSGQIFNKSVKTLHEYTDNIIKTKRMLLKVENNQNALSENEIGNVKIVGNRKNKSLLDLLLPILEESPDQMTDEDIREQVDTFLFAGHDTSSVAITMSLMLLGMHQDIQDRARDELYSIFGDSDRDVTMEDLNAMKYIDAIIKESLRIYPSVPGIARTVQETLQLKNYTIPPKTIVGVYPYILHRSEDIFPNPEEFIPERFLDEDNKSKFLFGYLPFSAGPRNCIGQKFAMNEMKIVVSNILRKAKIETLGTRENIRICLEVVIGIESIPKMKFYEI